MTAGIVDSPQVAARVLRLATPDFADIPAYIVPETEAARYLPALRHSEFPSTCLGYTGTRLSRHLQPLLVARNIWRGPGFACVLYCDRLKSTCGKAYGVDALKGFVIHEAAHWLDWAGHWLALEQDISDEQRLAIRRDPQWARYYSSPAPSADGHGASFIRAALHLHRRFNALSPVDLSWVYIAGTEYGLSAAALYAEALGDELTAATDKPIAAILRTLPPEPFIEFWEGDRRCPA